MDINLTDEVEKKFVSTKFIYEKSFSTSKRTEILKEILDEKSLEEIFKTSDLLKCKVLLTKKQEQHLFRKYNYLKYRISVIIRDKKKGKAKKQIEINKKIKEIKKIKEVLVKCNLRLIVKSVCKLYQKDSFNYEEFFSNGYFHMLRAIDHFDYTRNFKFSTYFINVLYRNLYEDKKKLYKKSFSSIEDIELSAKEISIDNQKYNNECVENLLNLLENYNPTKGRKNCKLASEILKQIYGVCGEKKMLQKEVAEKLGVSTSTVQNIVEDALKKLKKIDFVYDPLI
jgi:RNA polymerase sigma factor (sigma-70 family)